MSGSLLWWSIQVDDLKFELILKWWNAYFQRAEPKPMGKKTSRRERVLLVADLQCAVGEVGGGLPCNNYLNEWSANLPRRAGETFKNQSRDSLVTVMQESDGGYVLGLVQVMLIIKWSFFNPE